MDKIPYGTQYAYDNLSFLFPDADIQTNREAPLLYSEGDSDKKKTLIVISPQFSPEPDEMRSIIRFATEGHQVFISAFYFSDTVLKILSLETDEQDFRDGDSTQVSLLDPSNQEWGNYAYPGKSYDAFFTKLDTGRTIILGNDIYGRPDYIKLGFENGGAIFVHLNPLLFSNFFLLHRKNKSYYDLAFSYLPVKTSHVEWSDYFRYRREAGNFSSLRYIFGNRSLRWAFMLTLLLFLILFLIESKRKQRPVQESLPLRNASEDFVKTVGRLYFQQRNNKNLASKLVIAFFENVRSAYNLSTSTLNDEFIQKLAFRAGQSVSETSQLIQLIHYSRLNAEMSDQELMDLSNKITQFTKPA